MLRPRRFTREYDPGPVQIQARKVHFDLSDVPLHWIPGHPVASHVISVLNIVLPAMERWFVVTLNEALPLVKDPKLADDIRGFIGQEATHADVHERALHDFMVARGVNPQPLLDQVEFFISYTLGPTTSTDPNRRLNHLCDRLWLMAAIEHYTALLGDFALNSSWDDHGAHPTIVDLFRWPVRRKSNTATSPMTSPPTSTAAISTGSGRCWWRRRCSRCSSSAPPGIWSEPTPR